MCTLLALGWGWFMVSWNGVWGFTVLWNICQLKMQMVGFEQQRSS